MNDELHLEIRVHDMVGAIQTWCMMHACMQAAISRPKPNNRTQASHALPVASGQPKETDEKGGRRGEQCIYAKEKTHILTLA